MKSNYNILFRLFHTLKDKKQDFHNVRGNTLIVEKKRERNHRRNPIIILCSFHFQSVSGNREQCVPRIYNNYFVSHIFDNCLMK